MIRELFAVGLGGAAGSIVRYMLSVWLLGGHTLLGFPAGTFTVNAAGSLLIGILLETTNSAAAGWLLIAGFCGGFTTFSTFMNEGAGLMKEENYLYMMLYLFGSLALGLVAVLAGHYLAKIIA